MTATEKHWLEFEHPEYERLAPRWKYTRDHYTGDVLDPVLLRTYLVRKAVGESDLAYDERLKLADYTNFLAAVVDSLSGMLWGSDAKTNRRWEGEGGSFNFGAPEDQRTFIGRLYRDADGRGTPYITLWKQATVDLLLDQRIWVLADTVTVRPGVMRPVLRVLPALSVPNWGVDELGLNDVVVKEGTVPSQSVRLAGKPMQRRVVYSREGWERWEKVEGGAWTSVGNGAYAYTNPVGGAALPIFCVDLPLARSVGWILAKKANAIFNRESSRDNIINLANHPRLNIVADDTGFDKTVDQLVKGANALQVKPGNAPHGYIAPDSGPARIATEVLDKKRDDFFTTALREYGDAARQRTATEVRQDVAQGVGAFLSLLAAALDQAENGALWRLAQTERPGTDAAAVQARVERSDDFAVVDPEAAIDKLRERVFGKEVGVPIGNEARVAAARQIGEYLGLPVNEDEVRRNVALSAATDTISAYAGLPLVADVRVQMLRLLLESTQLLKDAPGTTMADGSTRPTLEAILVKAMELAEAEDDQARRGGEFLGAPGPVQPVRPLAGAAARTAAAAAGRADEDDDEVDDDDEAAA